MRGAGMKKKKILTIFCASIMALLVIRGFSFAEEQMETSSVSMEISYSDSSENGEIENEENSEIQNNTEENEISVDSTDNSIETEYPATGEHTHSFGPMEVVEAPTTTSVGSGVRYCTICNACKVCMIPELSEKQETTETKENESSEEYTGSDETNKDVLDEIAQKEKELSETNDDSKFDTINEISDIRDDIECEHTFDEGELVENDCERSKIYKCTKCGYIKEEQLSTPSHDWSVTYRFNEERESFIAEYTCSKCGTEGSTELGTTHLTKKAKCEEDGYIIYATGFGDEQTMTNGLVLTRQTYKKILPATGHNFVDGVCTNKGCGKTEDEASTQSEDTKHTDKKEETVDQNTCNHLFDADTCVVVAQPTCVDTGLSTITCSICGYKKEIVIPATGDHKYRTMTKKATCQKEGTKTTVCAVCKDTKVETLPKIDHNFVLNEDGTKYVCSMCGEEKAVENIENHIHDYKEEIIKEATCTTDGTKKYTCSCGDSYTETIKAGHKFEITEDEAVTCETWGHTVKVCSLCGKKQTETRTPLGHDFKNGVCTRCGKKSTECSHTWGEPTVTWSDDYSTATAVWHCTKNSAHTISETVDSVKMKEVSPTKCMTRGYIIYDAFFYKGSTKIASVSVPTKEFLWHDDEPISYIDPSECPTTYEMSFKCARCGKITKTYFTSSAHQFKNGRCIKCGTYESDVNASSGSTTESASSIVLEEPKTTEEATIEKTNKYAGSVVNNKSNETESPAQNTAQKIATSSESYDNNQIGSEQVDVSKEESGSKTSDSKTSDSTEARIEILEDTIAKLVSAVQKLTDLINQLLEKFG